MGGAVSSVLRAWSILLWQSFRHCCLLIAGHVQRWSLSSRVADNIFASETESSGWLFTSIRRAMLDADPGRSTVTSTSVALLLDYILTQQTIQNFVVALVCQSILPFKWKERRSCHLTFSLAPGIVFGTSQNWMARHIMTTSPTPTHTAVFYHFQNGESLATIRNIDHVSLIGLVGPHMVSKLPVWQPVRFVTIHCWESNPEQQCSCSTVATTMNILVYIFSRKRSPNSSRTTNIVVS